MIQHTYAACYPVIVSTRVQSGYLHSRHFYDASAAWDHCRHLERMGFEAIVRDVFGQPLMEV